MTALKIGGEVRTDTVIIRNNGGYFGTVPEEVAIIDKEADE